MKRRRLAPVLGALLATLAALPSPAARAEDKPAPVPIPYPNVPVAIDRHITKGTQGATTLKAIADEPAATNLTAAEKSAHVEYSAWVGTVADRLSAAVAGLSTAREHYLQKPSPARLKEMTSLDEHYLALVKTLQAECEKRAPVSTVLKTKHDTVKNSISNVR